MKKAELIKLLADVPDDAEIVVEDTGDDILGYYGFEPEFTIQSDSAVETPLGGLKATFSNGVTTDDEDVEVWVIR